MASFGFPCNGIFLCSSAIVGVGTAGIELLVIVAINANLPDLVQLYELPLWTSATVACSTAGLMLGGPVGSALTSHFGFRL
ncbi:MFS general substrate transporter [Penicillium herquei]|nr:MFS general substrate transporter [Penicillium herquei]